MMTRTIMGLAWPSFLSACLLEMLVFALVDPSDLHWSGKALQLSRNGVYSVAFFAFWAISTAGSALTAVLGQSIPPDKEPAGQA
jgi:hypothetical protein